MTPATSSWGDPALAAGQTYTDPDSGVSITTNSVSSTGAYRDRHLERSAAAHVHARQPVRGRHELGNGKRGRRDHRSRTRSR